MTTKRALVFLTVMVMMLMVPAVASAQSVPPHVFIGTVTVDGLAAPAGTTVSAVIDGVEQGSTSVTAGGGYVLTVSQGTGTDIVFLVDAVATAETASWQQGGADLLNLTAGGGSGSSSATGPVGGTGPMGAKGNPGDAGERGPAGPAGPKGDTGTPGVAGPNGGTGAAGPAGSDGTAGSAGAVGPAGSAGGTLFSVMALVVSAVAATLAALAFFRP